MLTEQTGHNLGDVVPQDFSTVTKMLHKLRFFSMMSGDEP